LFVESYNQANAFLRRVQDEEDGPLQGSGDVMRMERQLRTIIHTLIPDIPGSSHLTEPLTYDGTGEVAATANGIYTGSANSIELIYNASAGTWRYDGNDFTSGEEIDGVTIDIDPAGTPVHGDTLTLNVTPPTEELTYNSLSSIGIMASDEEGVLQVDEAALQTALADDAEGIFNMFAREAPADADGRKVGPDGLGLQLEEMLDRMIGPAGVVSNRERALQLDIKQYQDRIEMIERRLEIREERLVRQFTFMEQYISRIQEQTGLMSSFEAMTQGQGQEE
ncbi:MAG: flagellar filament capping protein FliD, partial [Bacillota bacterium]